MSSWVFHGVAGLLAIVGLLVLALALFRDRSRGRRRCPKCWYDLTGSGEDNRRCSECGYVARKPRTLYRTRRHWRWAMVGVFMLAGALASGASPHVGQETWLRVAPNTVLIAIAPSVDDGDSPTAVEEAAIMHLVRQRLALQSSNSMVERDVLWDWQWRWLCRKATPYVDKYYGQYQDRSYAQYAMLLRHAVGSGIVHEVGCANEVCSIRGGAHTSRIQMFGMHRSRDGAWRFFRDQPFGFSLHKAGPFGVAVDPKEVVITIDGRDKPLEWKRVRRPYFLGCVSGESFWNAVVYPPDDIEDGAHELTFHMREYVDFQYSDYETSDDLFVAEYEISARIETAGSYHNFIRPDHDPRLDARVRSNVRFDIDLEYQTVCVEINPAWQKLSKWIGEFWTVELVHDGKVVDSGTWELTGFKCFHMPQMPTAQEIDFDEVEGEWVLRFRMDPETMLVWDRPSDYWGGVIERPIDWAVELDRFESKRGVRKQHASSVSSASLR